MMLTVSLLALPLVVCSLLAFTAWAEHRLEADAWSRARGFSVSPPGDIQRERERRRHGYPTSRHEGRRSA